MQQVENSRMQNPTNTTKMGVYKSQKIDRIIYIDYLIYFIYEKNNSGHNYIIILCTCSLLSHFLWQVDGQNTKNIVINKLIYDGKVVDFHVRFVLHCTISKCSKSPSSKADIP